MAKNHALFNAVVRKFDKLGSDVDWEVTHAATKRWATWSAAEGALRFGLYDTIVATVRFEVGGPRVLVRFGGYDTMTTHGMVNDILWYVGADATLVQYSGARLKKLGRKRGLADLYEGGVPEKLYKKQFLFHSGRPLDGESSEDEFERRLICAVPEDAYCPPVPCDTDLVPTPTVKAAVAPRPRDLQGVVYQELCK